MNTYSEPIPHIYDMVDLAGALGLMHGYFLTREQGERAYVILKSQLELVPIGSPLVLIFPPNQLMDVSFADESIIRLGEEIIAGTFGERALLLQGLTSDSIKNLNAVIELRRLKLAFLVVEPEGSWQYVGHVERALQETLALVSQCRRLTGPELADQCGLAINTASTRLKRLYDQHLVRRSFHITKKGLEYTYEMWPWIVTNDAT